MSWPFVQHCSFDTLELSSRDVEEVRKKCSQYPENKKDEDEKDEDETS